MKVVKSCGCGCGSQSCGCCSGVEPLTPRPNSNRAGLPALSYRVGTHSSFLETMRARLSLHELPEEIGYDGNVWPARRPLGALTTRESSDPTIALLDAWATVADVLTFYQERIANEGFLRTATEMRSIFELARLVGYKPRPGVSSSTYLAYTIDSNTTEEVIIPPGARAQSVPGPGELPQSFETSEELRARASWNELKLRLEQPQRMATILTNKRVYLKGITTQLAPGDMLLARDRGVRGLLLRVLDVLPEPESNRTRVTVARWDGKAMAPGDAQRAAVEELENLIKAAPNGATARSIVSGLHAVLGNAGTAEAGNALPRAMVEAEDAAIADRMDALHGLASNLRPWAKDVRDAMTRTLQTDSKEPITDLEESSIVSRLARSASRPLANALQLPREINSNFKAKSDASLQLVGSVAPALRGSLGRALAGQMDAEYPQRLEIHAFRVRAGVFGRNANKRQRIVRANRPENSTHTEIIGEWPIVEFRGNGDGGDDGGGPARSVVLALHEAEPTLFLDMFYDGILPGSWVVIDSAPAPEEEKPAPLVRSLKGARIAQVRAASGKISRAAYGLSGDTVRLDLNEPWMKVDDKVVVGKEHDVETDTQIDADFRVIRGTTIYARSELMPLALEPIEDEICGGGASTAPAVTPIPFELDGLYEALQPGRFVILTGERADLGDAVVTASEALMISSVSHDVRAADAPGPWSEENARRRLAPDNPVAKLVDDTPHTFISFDKPLSYCYRRKSVVIRANVVKATHGETRNETLGNGDAGRSVQRFALKQFPLTYLAAPTAVGATTALDVFVNDVRWHEKQSFIDCKATDRVYVIRTDEDGKATVVLGNGIEGARAPTGIENVKAVYRFGIGKPGNVRAAQITMLATRPLGVKEVINPLSASGGANPESLDQARRNAPNAVMALDRLVSTRDYADFSRSFAGIGKAAAVELADGTQTVVHVTIAGSDDIPIDRSSDLFVNLYRALRELGDPFQPVRLAVRELKVLVLSAGVRIDPDYRWELVVSEVRGKLLQAFGFERSELGRDVTSSEVLSVMQSVRGTTYVDLDSFGAFTSMVDDDDAENGQRPRTPDEVTEEVAKIVSKPLAPRVSVAMARPSENGRFIRPAQIAVFLPDVEATLVLNRIE